MREKRRRPPELASGRKTLASRKLRCGTSPVAPWFLGVADEESYPRRADRPRGRGPTYNPFVGGNRSQSTAFWNARSARRARISVMNHYRTEETAALKRCGDHWKIIHSLLAGCQKRPARRRRSCGPAATGPPPHPPHHRQKAPSRPRCAPWRPATRERLY